MNDINQYLETSERALLKKAKLVWVNPMLATLHKTAFSKKDWLYECKFDGIRALVYHKNSQIKILSRNQIDISENYPEIVKELKKFHIADYILDGEIVAFKGKVTSFSTLQQRMHIKTAQNRIKKIPVFYYVFDIIYFENSYLEKLPLFKRKELLLKLFKFRSPILFTNFYIEKGIELFRKACSEGWEGIMAKYANSTYIHGRSKEWLKFKCIQKQEFVIGGFTAPKGSRLGFGALLIGYYSGKNLKYAGKVGTGFTRKTLKMLYDKLLPLRISYSPFGDTIVEKNIFWVRPALVAEIRFTEWTKDDKLRHPSFEGLRFDKSPVEIIKEEAESK